uniref:Uncharacterized protein n=1 Tax=Ditylenchus dipsaci TaxID=166011 RepID=A0A915CYB8_9BILA
MYEQFLFQNDSELDLNSTLSPTTLWMIQLILKKIGLKKPSVEKRRPSRYYRCSEESTEEKDYSKKYQSESESEREQGHSNYKKAFVNDYLDSSSSEEEKQQQEEDVASTRTAEAGCSYESYKSVDLGLWQPVSSSMPEVQLQHQSQLQRQSSGKLSSAKSSLQSRLKPSSSVAKNPAGSGKKVAVVTGAGGTIGSQVVDLLHSFDFNVVAVGRTRPENLVSKYGNSIRFVQCDLSDLRQAYKAADQIRSNYQRIEMLVCVAGTMLEPNSNSHPVNRVEPHLMVNLLSTCSC